MTTQDARQLIPPNRYRSGGPGRYRETAPRTERVNPHEAAGRAAKLAKLTRAVDDLARAAERPVTAVPTWLRTRTPKQWRMLAQVAGCNPPSETTQQALIEMYESSARGAL